MEYPDRRLTVIALRDQDSYAALLGGAPGKDVGGHYDLETNRLVIFDFRPQQEPIAAQAERVNLFTLVHETAHQLSFNTGILNRQADVPVCVSEGLATYVELWRPGVKNAIGGVNRPRMEALRQAVDWIQIGDLLAMTRRSSRRPSNLAYAESWLLVHYLLRASSRQPRFRQYLAEVPRLEQARRSHPDRRKDARPAGETGSRAQGRSAEVSAGLAEPGGGRGRSLSVSGPLETWWAPFDSMD